MTDSIAFLAPGLQVVDISNPASPSLLSTSTSYSGGVAVVDTFAYCSAFESLEVFSIANLRRPRRLAAMQSAGGSSADLVGGLLYVGGYRLEVFDISAPTSPVRVAVYATPDGVPRIRHDSSFVYAACSEGGLCIFRHCTTAVVEESDGACTRGFRVTPNPSRGLVSLAGFQTSSAVLSVRDAAGREVFRRLVGKPDKRGYVHLDLRCLPDGCYFVTASGRGDAGQLKVVLSRRK